MATQKRKRTLTRLTPSKRAKYTEASQSDHDDQSDVEDEEVWWQVGGVLDEWIQDGERVYQVEWLDIDPKTGKKYPPSATTVVAQDVLEEWEETKKRTGFVVESFSVKSAKGKRRQRKTQRAQPAHPPPRRERTARIVDSSPERSTAPPSSAPSQPSASSTLARESTIRVLSPDDTTARPTTATAPTRQSPRIPIAPRGSSFEPEAFEPFSQLPASHPPSQLADVQESDLDSSQLFAARRASFAEIVPDSQSSAGEASFAPDTQRTDDSTQQSTSADESQENTTQDSDLLGGRVQASARAASPAVSIPETIADTNTESQSQAPRAPLVDLVEIPDTLETPASSLQASHESVSEDASAQVRADQSLYSREVASEAGSTTQEESPGLRIASQVSSRVATGAGANIAQLRSTAEVTTVPELCTELHEVPESAAQLQAGPQQDLDPVVTERSTSATVPHTAAINPLRQAIDSGGIQAQSSLLVQDRTTPLVDVAVEASLAEQSAQDAQNIQYPPDSQPATHQLELRQQSLDVQSPGPQQPLESANTSAVLPATLPEVGFEAIRQTTTVSVASSAPSSAPSQAATVAAPGITTQALDTISTSAVQSAQLDITTDSSQVVLQTQQHQGPIEDASDSVESTRATTADSVSRRDFAFSVQPRPSTNQSTDSCHQHAQIVPLDVEVSTQGDTTECTPITQSIKDTIETDPSQQHSSQRRAGSLDSRHDSSQESPEPQPNSSKPSSSPIPQPPEYSVATLASKLPSRPASPVPSSSISIMSGDDIANDVARELQDLFNKAQAENPYVPTRSVIRRSYAPNGMAIEATTPSSTPARRFLRTQDSPSANIADGTRSPSTVPDRSPASLIPTSLRTVASPSSTAPPKSGDLNMDGLLTSTLQDHAADLEIVVSSEETAMVLDEPTAARVDDEELSDADDEESDDPLDDELQLDTEEYIVPLYIDGRQHDTYSKYIQQKKGILERFISDFQDFEPFSEVEGALQCMKDIETHLDLIYEEAGEVDSATQIEFAAKFGEDNSVKFKFLHCLFDILREENKHIVLVIEQEREELYRIFATFCHARRVNCNMPTRPQTTLSYEPVGRLSVTIIPMDASPILRSPDLIICINGVQEAKQLRRHNWAHSSDREVVPVLHLVIPRTVGHIERYLSPDADTRKRMYTTIVCLAQLRNDLGKPIDEDTPKTTKAAGLVATWLITALDEPLDWPLPSIGSVRDVIEFQTQLSQTSTTSPAPERNKRPLEDDEVDTAKRMRLTPQPNTVPSVSAHNELDITYTSNSMPGTAETVVSLQRQLAHAKKALADERSAREVQKQRFSKIETDWDRRQTCYEDLERAHRLLLGKQQTIEQQLETATKNKEVLQQRLADRTAELRQVKEELDAQRKTDSLSADEKVQKLTKLQTELAAAQEEVKKANSNQQSAESMFEYQNDARRNADNKLAEADNIIEGLTKENAKLQVRASGEQAKLKKLHLGKQYKLQAQQTDRMKVEIMNLKRTLTQREDELARAKSNVGRMGYGTRAQSVTPQPKVRSRAGSPMGGRVSNLRMNN
ncbi:hypothetical protein ACN47E_005969 [Coniothyrium glycines]